MFIVFYTVTLFMCIYVTRIDPWNVSIDVCVCVYIYIYMYIIYMYSTLFYAAHDSSHLKIIGLSGLLFI